MSRTRAEMIEETRVKLLAAARAFRDSGYAAASMDELTAAAGLTRGASTITSATSRDCWLRWPPNSTRKWTRGCSASRTRRPTPGRRSANAPGCAWRPNPKSSASRYRTRAPCWGRPRSRPSSPITSLATLLQSLMDEGQVRAAEPQALARLINGR